MSSRRSISLIIAAGAVLGLFAGCGKNTMEETSLVPDGELAFAAIFNDAPSTRGGAETTTSSIRTDGIGVFAFRTDQGEYFGGGAVGDWFLENQEFRYDAGTATFRGYDGASVSSVWWPLGSWASFFAYAPYNATVDGSSGGLKIPSDDYTGGFLRLGYTPPTNPAQQQDLCIAAPVLDAAAEGGPITLSFSHVLSRILFQARWTAKDEVVKTTLQSKGYKVKVQEISLENIRGTEELTFTRTSFQWDSPAAAALAALAGSSYSLSPENGCLLSLSEDAASLSLDYSDTFLVSPEATLYLLPQALATTASLRVRFCLFREGVELDQFEVAFSIGQLSQYYWPMGDTVTYRMTLDVGDPRLSFVTAEVASSPGIYEDGDNGASISGGYTDGENGASGPGEYVDGEDLTDTV